MKYKYKKEIQNKLHLVTGWEDVHSPTKAKSMNTKIQIPKMQIQIQEYTSTRSTESPKYKTSCSWSLVGGCSLADTPAATVSVSQQKEEECTARRLKFPKHKNTNTNTNTNMHTNTAQISRINTGRAHSKTC